MISQCMHIDRVISTSVRAEVVKEVMIRDCINKVFIPALTENRKLLRVQCWVVCLTLHCVLSGP